MSRLLKYCFLIFGLMPVIAQAQEMLTLEQAIANTGKISTTGAASGGGGGRSSIGITGGIRQAGLIGSDAKVDPNLVSVYDNRAIGRLREALERVAAIDPMKAVQAAVVESTRQSRAASPESWLDRFRVLDGDPALAGEAAAHWRLWAETISAYVQRRVGSGLEPSLSAAIGGAVQAAYVEVLRAWATGDRGDVDLDDLRRALQPLVVAFATVIPAPPQ